MRIGEALPLGPSRWGGEARRRGRAALLALGLLTAVPLALLAGGGSSSTSGVAVTAARADKAKAIFEGLPLRFERNAGQTDRRVRFLSRGPGLTLFLTPTEAVLSLAKPRSGASGTAGATATATGHATTDGAVLRMRLVGANAHPALSAAKPLVAKSNYFVGKRRVTGVSNYREVTYHRAYPGVDLVYHGRNGHLEYDFDVAPGANPSRIVLDFSGPRRMTIDRRGGLVLETAAGTLHQPRPVVYQRAGGGRRAVAGRYVLLGKHRVGFRLGAYDRAAPLVIDPAIVYSTYLGNGSPAGSEDHGADVAVDSSGAAYITGSTGDANFPTTTGAYQPTYGPTGDPNNGSTTAFVSKIDTTSVGAASLVYSTYLGGTFTDEGRGIAVDEAGHAYVTGLARSTDFPTKSPLPGSTCNGGTNGGSGAAFVAKLGTTGSSLVYSTCLGDPSIGTAGNRIAVGDSGAAYVTGFTYGGLPTTPGAYQSNPGGGSDAFLAELKPTASDGLSYSTFLGGAGDEDGGDVAVDGSGNAYVTGSAPSGFPTTAGAYQTTSRGGSDAFVAKFRTADSGDASLAYSTYLGGSGDDDRFSGEDGGIAVHDGHAYVTGATTSTDFPTQNPLQPSPGGDKDAFVAKLSLAGSALDYSTYLGGASFDEAVAIAVDSAGSAHVFGRTASAGFPTVDALPGSSCEQLSGQSAFVSRLSPSGSALSYSTCIPGADQGAAGGGIALDPAGNAYAAGTTGGADFPGELEVVDGFQDQRITSTDAFLVKLAPSFGGRPRVASLTPRGGPASGETPVVIRGQGFSDTTAVSFGATPAASFNVDSDSQITAVTPAHDATRAHVRVLNGAGSSPAQSSLATFYYGEGGWKTTGSLTSPRLGGQSATLLPDGKILVAGGNAPDFHFLASAELYDPRSETWTSTADMGEPRARHTATLLPNGKVLVAGGLGPGFNPSRSAELYDPGSGTWSSAGTMGIARQGHTATLLPSAPASLCGANCGKVLVVGSGEEGSDTAELYDPATNRWAATGRLAAPRGLHAATLISSGPASACGSNCGKVLVSGGFHSPTAPGAELYDPSTGIWTSVPGGPAGRDRTDIRSDALGDGRVVAAGGACIQSVALPSSDSQVFDPLAGAWSPTSPLLSGRSGHASAVLPNGKVLAVGGVASCQGPPNPTAEVFDPTASANGSWLPAGATQTGRPVKQGFGGPSAVVVSSDPSGFAADRGVCAEICGRVLIAGGTVSGLTELYTPPPTIRAVAPAAGGDSGGTVVTITGAGLNNGLRAVRFGGVPAASFSADSYGQVTAVSPPHDAGTVDVTVVTEGGEARRAGAFAFAGPQGSPGVSGHAVALVVTRFRLTNNPFVVGRHRTPLFGFAATRHKTGTTFKYTLSKAAMVKIVIAQRRFGRRKGTRCVAPTHALRHAKRCTRITRRGTLRRVSHQGANKVAFSGRIGSRALRPGRYRARLTATAANKTSKPHTLYFGIVRRRVLRLDSRPSLHGSAGYTG